MAKYFKIKDNQTLELFIVSSDEQPENSVLVTDENSNFMKPKANNIVFTEVVEAATPEEIAAANKALVPDTISRMGLKLQLLEFGIEIEEIIETINSIPDYMFPEIEKKKAIIKFNEAAYFDRYNADLNLVATLLGLSQEDLDTMFINGKSS